MSEAEKNDFLFTVSLYTQNCQIQWCFLSLYFRGDSWEIDSEVEICVHDLTGIVL